VSLKSRSLHRVLWDFKLCWLWFSHSKFVLVMLVWNHLFNNIWIGVLYSFGSIYRVFKFCYGVWFCFCSHQNYSFWMFNFFILSISSTVLSILSISRCALKLVFVEFWSSWDWGRRDGRAAQMLETVEARSRESTPPVGTDSQTRAPQEWSG
jgi:hypothetical protein